MHTFENAPSASTAYSSSRTSSTSFEHLPFTIRIASTDKDLNKAAFLRHTAYSRHLPEFAERLRVPEECDYDPNTVVLIAESKFDGSVLGTTRIQTNHHRPLQLENAVNVQRYLGMQCLAEITRLATALGRESRLVKIALFKGLYLYCMTQQVDWMVICARSPLDRQYIDLNFADVIPEGGYQPMPHIGNVPHRLLGMKVQTAERQWHELQHPLYHFVFETCHPDIKIVEKQLKISPYMRQIHSELEAIPPIVQQDM